MGSPWTDKGGIYNLAVVVGRFQPLHLGHIHNIKIGLEKANKVLILVGSAYNSRSIKNPFSYEERRSMIVHSLNLPDMDFSRVFIEPLADNIYEENQWLTNVQEIVSEYAKTGIALIGHNKDDTSYYLKSFPSWHLHETGRWPDAISTVDATKIRELWFDGNMPFLKGIVPEYIYEFLIAYYNTPEYKDFLIGEWIHNKAYHKAWANSPFPPTFNTVDAVVVQSGHILLVERGDWPGKGLMALPGGFLGKNEKQVDAVIRELREETGLKVPVPVLYGSIRKEKTFDHPGRSTRGRTITQAFLIQLKNDEELPKIKGGDDAKSAHWVPLSEFYEMESEMYEDHFYIVRKMLDNE